MNFFIPEDKLKKISKRTLRSLFLIALIYVLFFSDKNCIQYFKTLKLNKDLKTELAEVENRNMIFTEKIDAMKNDPDYIEKVAREEHKLKKKDEVVIYFVEENKKSTKK